MTFKGEQYLWTDRKRYLGLPLSFTRYALSDDRLFLSVGFLNLKDDELLLYRVRDISVTRSLFQRIFGVGTILVNSSDKSNPTLQLQNVKDPLMVKELLHEQVEQMKTRRRVHYSEINSFNDDMEDDLDFDLDGDGVQG
ncbi:MAG: PH domain-containing protein [Oscillospiraceae bacterium]|nr:PH domain-containing protein [Oscillospiraceae bacterium]